MPRKRREGSKSVRGKEWHDIQGKSRKEMNGGEKIEACLARLRQERLNGNGDLYRKAKDLNGDELSREKKR